MRKSDFIALAAVVVMSAYSYKASASVCSEAAEATSTPPDQIDLLCENAPDSNQPAECFRRAAISGGYRFAYVDFSDKPRDAVWLCRGTRDARETLRCFREEIETGGGYYYAMGRCNPLNAPAAPEPSTGPNACRNAVAEMSYVRGRGDAPFPADELERLCGGNETSIAPAECFRRAVHSNYQASTVDFHRNPNYAVWLCRGARNAEHVLRCFKEDMELGANIWYAMAYCNPQGTVAEVPPEALERPRHTAAAGDLTVNPGVLETAGGGGCRSGVQGRIPWSPGNTNWAEADLAALCRGAENSSEPGNCFNQVMTGGVNWGGGTTWNPKNALALCKGSQNAAASVSCFQSEISQGRDWQQAIQSCNNQPGVAATGAVAATGVAVREPVSVSGSGCHASVGSGLDQASVAELCTGAEESAEPGKCFRILMSGDVNWGGGTSWNPKNAVALCRGSHKASTTVSCFQGEISQGRDWQQAIQSCNKPSAAAATGAVAATGVAVQEPVSVSGGGCRADIGGSLGDAEASALCAGAEGSSEPGKCFRKLMAGGVNWGGGTSWNPKNAVALCKGSTDATATINCFSGKISSGVGWQQAIPACQASAGSETQTDSQALTSAGGVANQILVLQGQETQGGSSNSIQQSSAGGTSGGSSGFGYVGLAANGLTQQRTLNLIGGPASALSAFRLRFENGDHKIKRIVLLRFPETMQAALNDNDGNDPFEVSARYLELGGQAQLRTITEECVGTCDVAMPRLPPDQTALLAGFAFDRPRGDNNLRRIGVRLDAQRGIAVVAFLDDKGLDARWGSGAEKRGFSRTDERGYQFTLQYVVVPSQSIDFLDRVSGTTRKNSNLGGRLGGGGQSQAQGWGWSEGDPTQRRYAIQAFELQFTNKDHHLLELGINLHRQDEIVAFQDNNRNDPIRWSVDYAVFK